MEVWRLQSGWVGRTDVLKEPALGASLVVYWLRPHALNSTPVQGTGSQMSQLRPSTAK